MVDDGEGLGGWVDGKGDGCGGALSPGALGVGLGGEEGGGLMVLWVFGAREVVDGVSFVDGPAARAASGVAEEAVVV